MRWYLREGRVFTGPPWKGLLEADSSHCQSVAPIETIQSENKDWGWRVYLGGTGKSWRRVGRWDKKGRHPRAGMLASLSLRWESRAESWASSDKWCNPCPRMTPPERQGSWGVYIPQRVIGGGQLGTYLVQEKAVSHRCQYWFEEAAGLTKVVRRVECSWVPSGICYTSMCGSRNSLRSLTETIVWKGPGATSEGS